MDEQKKQKTLKILNIVVNVVVAIILVLALIVTINNVSTKKKGYTSIFGTAYMVVQSSSMDPDGQYAKEYAVDYKAQGLQAGFAKGDLLRVKILKTDEEKKSLQEGDIISFLMDVTNDDGDTIRIVNSHRIIERHPLENGDVEYRTRGDNNSLEQTEVIQALETAKGTMCVIGVVKGNLGGIGKALDFFNTSTGFLVCVVIPSFLIVAWFAFDLIREIVRVKKVGAADAKAKYEEELIAKLRAQGVEIPANLDTSAPAENNETPTDGESKK